MESYEFMSSLHLRNISISILFPIRVACSVLPATSRYLFKRLFSLVNVFIHSLNQLPFWSHFNPVRQRKCGLGVSQHQPPDDSVGAGGVGGPVSPLQPDPRSGPAPDCDSAANTPTVPATALRSSRDVAALGLDVSHSVPKPPVRTVSFFPIIPPPPSLRLDFSGALYSIVFSVF